MQRTKPPFRADQVGSFLRSKPIVEARVKREKGAITAAELTAVEDAEIPKIIKKQEEAGMQLATDGEFRRAFWHFDFYSMLDGVELYELDHGIQFHGVETKPKSIRVTGKIGFPADHPMLGHFRFLKDHTKVVPKMTIPSPNVLHFRLEPGAVDKATYADRDAIFPDLIAAYKAAVKAFYDAGCRYLQFDDTAEELSTSVRTTASPSMSARTQRLWISRAVWSCRAYRMCTYTRSGLVSKHLPAISMQLPA
jgi:5-methyltetrahydropteroyltriglutamate--homocysteine methyltransferase